MPSLTVRPSNRCYQAEGVKRVSVARSIGALHHQRRVAGEFVHTQTPMPAFDQTHFHVSHDGKDLLVAVAPYNSIGKYGADEGVELFFDPYHDHLGFFQFVFVPPPAGAKSDAAAEPLAYSHLPYGEAATTRFAWLKPKEVTWAEHTAMNVVGVQEYDRWLFARFPVAGVFRNGRVCGFNICRVRNAINETASWNLASGNGFVDATGFGHLWLGEGSGDGASVPEVAVTRAELNGRTVELTGTAAGLAEFELELADPLDRRAKIAVRTGSDGAWSARAELPGEEAGRYRLYPRSGGAAVEPEFLYFDLAEPARMPKFTVGMFYDVPDDLRNNYYTPGRLDAQFRRLASWGVNRLYWIDYGPTNVNKRFWEAVSANCPRTHKECGDLLPLAARLAHERGMEFIGVFKPFDMGFTYPIFDKGGKGLVRGPENRYSPVLQEVADHARETMSDHPAWRVDPELPITRLRVMSETPLPRLRAADLKLSVSDDNKRYRPYRGPVTVRVAEERVPHRRFTAAGVVDDDGGGTRRAWTIELSGLKIGEPYVALECGRKGLAADARHFEFFEAFDARGRSIRVHLNDGGGFEKGFNFLVVWAGWANQTERLLGRRAWKGEPIAAFLRPYPNLPTMLEPAYEASRRVWLGYVRRLLDAGCDGADLRTLCHHNACASWLVWAFAEPVRAMFRERFGREVEATEEDYARVRVLRGECYTGFVREASALARERGRKLVAHLESGVEAPPSLHSRMHLHVDWRRWVEEGLVDELTLKYWGSQNPWVHENVLPLARRKCVPVHICEPNFTLHNPRGVERGARLTREAHEAGFHGYAYYETASYLIMNPEGVSLPFGHADKSIRASAEAVGAR